MSVPGLDHAGELRDLVVDLAALLHQGRDLLDRVNHGCVITPPEFAGDRRITEVRELAKDIHADLAGGDEGSPAAGATELVDAEPEHLRCRLEDSLWRHDYGGVVGHQVGKNALGQLDRQGLDVEARVGANPDESALELADVVLHVAGDEFEDLVGDRRPFALCLLAQDGESGLQLRWLHVCDQSRQKSTPEPIFQGGDGPGGTVGGADYLLRGSVER